MNDDTRQSATLGEIFEDACAELTILLARPHTGITELRAFCYQEAGKLAAWDILPDYMAYVLLHLHGQMHTVRH